MYAQLKKHHKHISRTFENKISKAGFTGNSHMRSLLQRVVVTNWNAAYNENVVVGEIFYKREGNPGGGHHFVSDKWISELIIDAVIGVTKKNMIAPLGALANEVNAGVYTGPPQLNQNKDFDSFVEGVIKSVSSSSANHFTGQNTGDNGGTTLDSPNTNTKKKKCARWGEKFRTAIMNLYTATGIVIDPVAQGYLDQMEVYGLNNPN